LAHWLEASGIEDGPLFRPIRKGGTLIDARLAGRSVAIVVKARAQAAGLDPSRFSGHSLRRGWITSAAEAGADVFRIMDVSRHRRVETVRTYIQIANEFVGHAGATFA
jgi:integrase